MPHSTTAWILTDGKAGDENQCLGVAEAMQLKAEIKRIAPRKPWSLIMPFGSIDPHEAPHYRQSPIAPPFPDIVIASGRRTVAYLRVIKKASARSTMTVFLKDPKTGHKAADFIWVPEHDRLRGPNVLTTLTSPHRLSASALAQARQQPWPIIHRIQKPRVAVLVGGNSTHHHFTDKDCQNFLEKLSLASDAGAHFMITLSRRTPIALARELEQIYNRDGHFFWSGEGNNPYVQFLAHADHLIVTTDSVNMVGEALATGKAVHIFHPSGGHKKIKHFIDQLAAMGIVFPFDGHLRETVYDPIDATPVIAQAIWDHYQYFRSHMRDSTWE